MITKSRFVSLWIAALALLAQTARAINVTMAHVTLAQIPDPRFNETSLMWGGNTSFNGVPNVGMIIYNSIMVYIDLTGPTGWVLIFAVPFVMAALAGADMIYISIPGIILSLYVFLKLPSEYILFAVAAMVISIAGIVWSLYKRNY
jgi:hypothetical protein